VVHARAWDGEALRGTPTVRMAGRRDGVSNMNPL